MPIQQFLLMLTLFGSLTAREQGHKGLNSVFTLRKQRQPRGSLFLLSNLSEDLPGPRHIQFCLVQQAALLE